MKFTAVVAGTLALALGASPGSAVWPFSSSSSAPASRGPEKLVKCTFPKGEHVYEELVGADLDVWKHDGTAGTVDVRVRNADDESLLEKLASQFNLQCETAVADLDELAAASHGEIQVLRKSWFGGRAADPPVAPSVRLVDGSASETDATSIPHADSDPFFLTYQSHDMFCETMRQWAAEMPVATFVRSIGESTEYRTIPALILTAPGAGKDERPTIFLNGGLHAREWIAPATVMYVLRRLMEEYALGNGVVTFLLNRVRIVATPLSNPDGYEFSRTPGNRWWRKNRRRNADGSYGVDLNRNFDDHWNLVGASSKPTSETYPGTQAFSEMETRALSRFIMRQPNRLAGVDLHSYGQLILRNWGYTVQDAPREEQLKALGNDMRSQIKHVSGRKYDNIKGADLYPASGAMDDWMTREAGMTAYTIELPDKGKQGFALSKWEITSVGREIYAALREYFLVVALRDM